MLFCDPAYPHAWKDKRIIGMIQWLNNAGYAAVVIEGRGQQGTKKLFRPENIRGTPIEISVVKNDVLSGNWVEVFPDGTETVLDVADDK